MVDLDSDPTKLINIVGIGKQLLITRGALTTFSVANDVAKYFAIVPALFTGAFPGLGLLNIMGLASPSSAILSAVIFNALIIIALVPLALRASSTALSRQTKHWPGTWPFMASAVLWLPSSGSSSSTCSFPSSPASARRQP